MVRVVVQGELEAAADVEIVLTTLAWVLIALLDSETVWTLVTVSVTVAVTVSFSAEERTELAPSVAATADEDTGAEVVAAETTPEVAGTLAAADVVEAAEVALELLTALDAAEEAAALEAELEEPELEEPEPPTVKSIQDS